MQAFRGKGREGPEPQEATTITCCVLAQGFLAAAAVRRHWSDGQRGWTRQRGGQVRPAGEGLVVHRDSRVSGDEQGQLRREGGSALGIWILPVGEPDCDGPSGIVTW